ncbi:MAG: hypothetical protein A2017_12425 [Lentisphaerae bacterium GWF2_44_16]|nr:MAG: hypothetical protein A2017_12425 [Lentisphaerae bacterium GWF2_44_16]
MVAVNIKYSKFGKTADPLGYPDRWNNLAYCNNDNVNNIDLLLFQFTKTEFVKLPFQINL